MYLLYNLFVEKEKKGVLGIAFVLSMYTAGM